MEQLHLYEKQQTQLCFLMSLIGITLKQATSKTFIATNLTTLFNTVNHKSSAGKFSVLNWIFFKLRFTQTLKVIQWISIDMMYAFFNHVKLFDSLNSNFVSFILFRKREFCTLCGNSGIHTWPAGTYTHWHVAQDSRPRQETNVFLQSY